MIVRSWFKSVWEESNGGSEWEQLLHRPWTVIQLYSVLIKRHITCLHAISHIMLPYVILVHNIQYHKVQDWFSKISILPFTSMKNQWRMKINMQKEKVNWQWKCNCFSFLYYIYCIQSNGRHKMVMWSCSWSKKVIKDLTMLYPTTISMLWTNHPIHVIFIMCAFCLDLKPIAVG